MLIYLYHYTDQSIVDIFSNPCLFISICMSITVYMRPLFLHTDSINKIKLIVYYHKFNTTNLVMYYNLSVLTSNLSTTSVLV